MRITSSLLLIILCVVVFSDSLWAQNKIHLANPSFEGIPHRGGSNLSYIAGWQDCGPSRFPGETPPDLHPGFDIKGSFWENEMPASDGITYLGVVTRDNDTWEGLSQRLLVPLEAGKCYEFSMELAASSKYLSRSAKMRSDTTRVSFTNGIMLRVVGGSGYCSEREVLLESPLITHNSWKTYNFRFESTFEHRYITVEAYYKPLTFLPYNGHVLVDNLSPFVEVPCDEEEMLLALAKKKSIEKEQKLPPHKRARINKARKKAEKEIATQDSKPTAPKVVEAKILTELNDKNLVAGTTIEIKDLYFEADSSEIQKESYPVLDEVADFLKYRTDVSVEIGGHTNASASREFADKLSTMRAKAVYNYLRGMGVDTGQLEFRGYGKRRRKVPVERTLEDKKKNQRVEIKIIKVG